MGLERESGPAGARRRLQRVDPRRRLPQVTGADHDHPGTGQAGGHQLVLGLGRLHDKPRDPGPPGLLQQVPDGLRLARPGRPAHEHVPVKRRGRHRQLTARHPVPVQDLPQPHRACPARASRRGLRSHVELRARHHPQSRHLPRRHPGQRRNQRGRTIERGGRPRLRPPPVRRRGARAGRQQRVRQAHQVAGGPQQPGYLRGLPRGRPRGQQGHPPQAGGRGLPQLLVPGGGTALGRAWRGGCRSAAPPAGPAPPRRSAPPAWHRRPARPAAATRTAPATPTAARPPATAARPARPAAGPARPGRRAAHRRPRPAAPSTRPPPAAGQSPRRAAAAPARRQHEHVLPVIGSRSQPRAGGDHPHRAPSPLPHPGDRDRGTPPPRRHQLRSPLHRPVTGSPLIRPRLLTALPNAGHLGQLPGRQR